MGYEDVDVSALLSVRYLPGYPYKCPKLQITPEKGLLEADGDKLLSLLYDQANSNAREGRVMIYNLVEAAQEYLSEIVPLEHSHELVPSQATDRNSVFSENEMTVSCDKSCFPAGPFVYGFLDLFSGSGESWNWGLAMEANGQIDSTIDGSGNAYGTLKKSIDHDVKPLLQETKQGPLRASTVKLDILEEESEDESKTTDSRTWLSDE